MRFVAGHHLRLPRPWRRRRQWALEDRGFKTPCHIWQLSLNEDGYGRWNGIDKDGRRRSRQAHRELWEQTHGPVPQGYELDHLCRQRDCVNLAHLEVVTHTENMRRSRNRKLTDGDVVALVAYESEHGSRATALAFGISQGYVRRLVRQGLDEFAPKKAA